MQVGLRNSKEEIHREVGITGLSEFLSFVQYLQDIGIVDELAAASGPRRGYDAIFERGKFFAGSPGAHDRGTLLAL